MFFAIINIGLCEAHVFRCLKCICTAEQLVFDNYNILHVSTMDCSHQQLSGLPSIKKDITVDITIMTGTPYCNLHDNKDHEVISTSYNMIKCEIGKETYFYLFYYYYFF